MEKISLNFYFVTNLLSKMIYDSYSYNHNESLGISNHSLLLYRLEPKNTAPQSSESRTELTPTDTL